MERTKTVLQKRKRTWIITIGIIVLILTFVLGKAIVFDVVKPGLVREGIDRKSALEKCGEQNYFMVRFNTANTGLMYVISEGEDKGIEVELTGNTPLTDLSDVFRDGRNEFLIYGHEINAENKTKNAVVNGYPEAPYTIVVEDWEIITPIYRDYTYSRHERLFAPRGYFDSYDLKYGDCSVSEEVDEVWRSIEEHENGEIAELSIEKMTTLKAEKEECFGYSKESLEWSTFWWQAFSQEHYQYLRERFGIEEKNLKFDFENHYYLISYGRPVKKLYSDSTKMYADTVRGRVPGAKTEWDEETPYESGLVYIYETDKVALVDIEWN